MSKVRNPVARRAELRRLMLAHETASVETLCELLSASPATVRRDLAALEAEGALERTHGGAALAGLRPAEQNFAQRELQDVAEKLLIAEAVVRFIPPGSTIFMNDGSTIAAIAKAIISAGIEVFVATPAVNVATKLAESPRVTACLLGGFVRATSLATAGHFAEAMVTQINADLAIIAPDGISVEAGVTFADSGDAGLARRMMAQSRCTIVVATAGKLTRNARTVAAPVNAVARLVTVASAETSDLAAAGLSVVNAEEQQRSGNRPSSNAFGLTARAVKG